ncbi:oxidoreductase [Isobaculum melis]|uniref:Putative quinone oxidoreductase, YhdH/YhfP family n=1 Tax=Isobaculum melis TaxID=142588 RepID=A0A1H9PPF8_9LACT|nr:oxidoreductase [Isobaculum melis]SER50226.1 putative quinone oxidoreductase, YhdH/YhfP family [Isobaculum melis]
MNTFKALVVTKQQDQTSVAIEQLSFEDLSSNEVLIEVHYSGVNYKDALATKVNGAVARTYPLIPGIDLAGVVKKSSAPQFKVGQEVLITGYDLGTAHHGGYSEYACVPAEWVVPLPENLSMKEAMIVGTAGFTAALSIYWLEKNGITPEQSILVTGATGGVGSMSVAMLKALGYQKIVASSRKATSQKDFLAQLGATEILSPEDLPLEKNRPLAKQKWHGVIDPVAGPLMPQLFAQVAYNGAYAVSGLTAGTQFEASVFPFILRGIKLLGIDSVACPTEIRLAIWQRIASDMKPKQLEQLIDHEVQLEELPAAFDKILAGKMVGRTIVTIKA